MIGIIIFTAIMVIATIILVAQFCHLGEGLPNNKFFLFWYKVLLKNKTTSYLIKRTHPILYLWLIGVGFYGILYFAWNLFI